MKLKKPAKDHRGSWDLVLDNDGTTVASLKFCPKSKAWKEHWEMLWPIPRNWEGVFEFETYWQSTTEATLFLENVGVDTAPLEKLMEEKLMEEKGE